jgi:uncharacterized protein YydD (DUF2326 family)
MKLSKLYSNFPQKFPAIYFRSGLNVVLAEIRDTNNKDKDTHDLGKTTLGRLLDFCLLTRIQSKDDFFLTQNAVFSDFIFYLEIELFNGRYLTIRRGVETNTKISLIVHDAPDQDFDDYPDESWTHWNISSQKAKTIIEGILDFRNIKPYSFRDGMTQFLRLQDDFREIFNRKNARGKDADWKPFVAKILGLDDSAIIEHFKLKTEIDEKKKEQKKSSPSNDIGKILGALDNAKAEREEIKLQLEQLDFHKEDKRIIETVVNDTGVAIETLNGQLYYLEKSLKKITESIKEGKFIFDPEQISQLFEETIKYFPEQIKVDYEQLIQFNHAITSERNEYLRKEREKIQYEIQEIRQELEKKTNRQKQLLSALKDSDILNKYKHLSSQLRDKEIEIARLEDQHEKSSQYQHLNDEIKMMKNRYEDLAIIIKNDIKSVQEDSTSRFGTIRRLFSTIIKEILGNEHKVILSIAANKKDNIEFNANFYNDDVKTNEDLGNTYKRLLCMAFDLAVIASYLSDYFPRVVFHDGIFEGLDIRKRELLREVYREYAAKGIQIIVTSISSDLIIPDKSYLGTDFFKEDEMILHLHDDGENGRLFKMKTW